MAGHSPNRAFHLGRSLLGAGVIWLLLPLLLAQCKKDVDGPSNYHFIVVDELTGEALADAPVVLEEVSDGSYHFDTIGSTNENGVFEYVFTGQPTHGSTQGYHQWFLHFFRSDFYPEVYASLQQDHVDHDVTLGLVKRAVISFTATRVGSSPYISFGFSNDFDSFVWHGFGYVFPGEVNTHYQSAPSNRTTTIKWGLSPMSPLTEIPVLCGHGDTTFVTVEF